MVNTKAVSEITPYWCCIVALWVCNFVGLSESLGTKIIPYIVNSCMWTQEGAEQGNFQTVLLSSFTTLC